MAGGFAGTLHIGTVSSSGASLLDWRIPAFHEQYRRSALPSTRATPSS